MIDKQCKSMLNTNNPVTNDWLMSSVRALEYSNASNIVLVVDSTFNAREPMSIILSAILVPTRHADRLGKAQSSMHQEFLASFGQKVHKEEIHNDRDG